MTTVTTTYRRESFAAQATAATSTRARKRAYVRLLVGVDLSLVAIAVWSGYLARFQGEAAMTDIPYQWVGLGLIALWMFFLVWSRCYDDRVLGYGADEYRRMVSASLKLAGSVAIAAYLADAQVSRGFLGFAFLAGTAILPVGRYLTRQALHRARSRDEGWSRRVLIVGDASHVIELSHQLRREG